MKKGMSMLFLIITVTLTTFTSCKKEGCTDATAINYNEDSRTDDGSCQYLVVETGDTITTLPIDTTNLTNTANIIITDSVLSDDGGNLYITMTLENIGTGNANEVSVTTHCYRNGTLIDEAVTFGGSVISAGQTSTNGARFKNYNVSSWKYQYEGNESEFTFVNVVTWNTLSF